MCELPSMGWGQNGCEWMSQEAALQHGQDRHAATSVTHSHCAAIKAGGAPCLTYTNSGLGVLYASRPP